MKNIFVILILALTIQATARPMFGVIGTSDGGIGALIYDDRYSAAVLYSTIENKDGFVEENLTQLEFNAKFKHPISTKSVVTLGGKYIIVDEKPFDDDDSDENLIVSITTGIEYKLEKNIILFAETDAYRVKTFDDGKKYDSTTSQTGDTNNVHEKSFFKYARVGINIIF